MNNIRKKIRYFIIGYRRLFHIRGDFIKKTALITASTIIVLSHLVTAAVNHIGGGYGVHFFGDKGEVKVNRRRFETILNSERVAGYDPKDRRPSLYRQLMLSQKTYLKDVKVQLYKSEDHTADFLKCIISSNKPISNEVVGGPFAICCRLMNYMYYNHATIDWESQKLIFTNATDNPRWLTKNYQLLRSI